MSAPPTLLFYCQHSLGLGHLARSLALCEALVDDFRVILLAGGTLPPGLPLPEGVEVVALPPLALAADRRVVSDGGGLSVQRARAARLQRILATVRSAPPDVLVVELFPFGRKKFSEELVPLLRVVRDLRGRGAVVACSLRDILVSRGGEQRRHDERASRLANRWYDLVLVHSDARVARLEESFAPATPLRIPVYHTGFVMPNPPPNSSQPRTGPVVVSAGGGRVGEPLLRAAIGAHRLLGPHTAMKVIAGPFLPEEQWRSLRAATRGRAGVELVRSVENLEDELGRASASVSQCGYNTALEILRARVPAVVVPFAEEGEDEQMRRARRLASLGALMLLDPRKLDAPSLAAEIRALGSFSPTSPELDLTGARSSAALLARLTRDQAAA